MRLPLVVALGGVLGMLTGVAFADEWVRPPARSERFPVWGHANGIQVGLPWGRGPWGLLYVYADAITSTPHHVLNFIAIEPIVGDARGLSELEPSQLDARNGKRFWSADEPDFKPRDPLDAARGVATSDTLQVYIMSERFRNGAQPYVRMTFHSNAPGEVSFETFCAPDATTMSKCVLTATMGNYARLRRIWLRERVEEAGKIWPEYRGKDFADRRYFPLRDLWRSATGEVLFALTPDEADPAASSAPGHWSFLGVPATQYWRIPPDETGDDLTASANGRFMYWRSRNPIPGGIAVENFEIERPFRPGEKSTFGVTTTTVETLRKSFQRK